MDPMRPSTPSPSGLFSDICSGGEYTKDIAVVDHGRTRPTGSAPPGGGVLPQRASSVSARYDTLEETQRVTVPGVTHLTDSFYPPSQDDSDLDNMIMDYPLSGHRDIRPNPSSMLPSGYEKHAYRSPTKHPRYDGDSFFQYLDSESAALQYLSSSSPPQSSPPLPQSSPPSDDLWLSSCLAPTVLDPTLEEDYFTKFTKASLSGSTPDLSPDSQHSTASYDSRPSIFETFENHSSKSSLTSGSSHSGSFSHSRSDSPGGAHTNTDYDFESTYVRDDGFTDRLHQLLLVVAREREREREQELEQGPERVVECDADCFCQSIPYAYRNFASAYTDAISPPCDSRGYELSPLNIETSALFPNIIDDEFNTYAPSPFLRARDSYFLGPATFTASPTLYNPSATLSPLDRSSEEYQYDFTMPDTELDTLVFASPSCSPARALKRPRSLSNDQTNVDHLSFKRKLRKTGCSVFSS